MPGAAGGTATKRRPNNTKKTATPRQETAGAQVVPEPVPLPPIGVARFHETLRFVERLIEAKTDVFLSAATRYRARHAEHASDAARPLTFSEAAAAAAQFADIMGGVDDPAELAADIQQSGLRAIDPPDQRELMLAAGLATAPEFLDAALKFAALIEMPPGEFKQHRKAGSLDHAIENAVEGIFDDDPPVREMRDRAARAFDHFAGASGEDPGKAVGLIRDLVGQALTMAMTQATQDPSGQSSSIGLQAPTDSSST